MLGSSPALWLFILRSFSAHSKHIAVLGMAMSRSGPEAAALPPKPQGLLVSAWLITLSSARTPIYSASEHKDQQLQRVRPARGLHTGLLRSAVGVP